MKHTLTILLLLGFTLSTNAQKKELIIGKWKFEDFVKKQETNSSMIEFKEMVFKKMTFFFNAHGHYQTERRAGTWRLNEDESKIIFTDDNGYEYSDDLLKISKDTLRIKTGMYNDVVIFTRTPLTEEDDLEELPIKLPTMSASREEISRKWYLQKRETLPNANKKPSEPSTLLTMMPLPRPPHQIKGSYIRLSEEGKYKARFDNNRNKTNSTWTFGENNTSIIVPFGIFGKKILTIHKISETELILIKGINEKWYFSTKKIK